MINGYNSRFLQSYLKSHIEIEDTIPDLVEIHPVFQEKDSSAYQQFNTHHWNQFSIQEQSSGHCSQNGREFYQSLGVQKYINQIEELQLKLEQKVERIKVLEQQQEESERVIAQTTLKNKELTRRINKLHEMNIELQESKEKMEEQLDKMRLKDNFKNINQLQVKKSATQYNFEKGGLGESKKQIYEKVEGYVKRVVEEFMNTLKTYKISEDVERQIEEFLSQLLNINSQTVDRMYKNMGLSRGASESKPNRSMIATPRQTISPVATNRNYLNQNHENDGVSGRKSESFYYLCTDRKNEKSQSFIKDGYHQISKSRREKSQRRMKIFE